MSKHDDGGPASPVAGHTYGLSIADWFAGTAIHAARADSLDHDDIDWIAARAYRIADAMIAEKRRRETDAKEQQCEHPK